MFRPWARRNTRKNKFWRMALESDTVAHCEDEMRTAGAEKGSIHHQYGVDVKAWNVMVISAIGG